MSRLRYIVLIFIAATIQLAAHAEQRRLLVTFQFNAHPEDNELYWLTDTLPSGSGALQLYPLSLSSLLLNPATDSWPESFSDLILKYRSLHDLNVEKRQMLQSFSKTWTNTDIPRDNLYVNVYVCPLIGDFTMKKYGDREFIDIDEADYDNCMWADASVKKFMHEDFSGFDFRKYSDFRSHMASCTPSISSDGKKTIDSDGKKYVVLSVVSANNLYPEEQRDFLIKATDPIGCDFEMVPVCMENLWGDSNLMEVLLNNSRMIQVVTKTWPQSEKTFEYSRVYACPVNGSFGEAIDEYSDEILSDSMRPVGDFKYDREFWDTRNGFIIKVMDYSLCGDINSITESK